jgi:hypothetical protein
MSLTKAQISDLVSDLAGGGDQPQNSKFHSANVAKLTEIAYSTVIDIAYNEMRNEGDHNLNGDFYKTFEDVPVKLNSNRDEYYSDLPCKFISLRNNKGIGTVSQMQNQKEEFFPVKTGSLSIWDGLEASYNSTRPEYYIEGDKIFYKGLPVQCDRVLIRLVACIDELDNDEPIPVPAQYEDSLLKMVLEKLEMQEQTIQDKYNDTNTK